MEQREAPFMAHLAELRVYLIRAVIGIFVCMVVCYGFVDYLLAFLKAPMLAVMPEQSSFVVLSPQEYFFTELKAALFFGLILSSPWVFLQIWAFIAPGLYRNERQLLVFFVITASICFIGGLLFAYFLVFPPTFKFFIETLPNGVQGAYSIAMLYGFAITVLMAFGIVFQTPIAVFLLVLFELVQIETLAKYRRIVLVLAFVFGALLTPPDPITQVMLAAPAYLLFELGLLAARLTLKKRKTARAHRENS